MTTTEVLTLERTETKLVGYSATTSLHQDLENNIIVGLREKLIGKRHEIVNAIEDTGIYLVQVYSDEEWSPDVPFESIVAVEVSQFADIPEGLVQHTIPSGKYAKVIHKGPESEIGETYDWIRNNGIDVSRPFDFEYWTNINSHDQEDSTIDIFLPMID
ncbi:GyrI-like domain-containing protein [Paenibacillus sp. L3-i20]|uniref:GyrI-like domain-containing protein n=1 Tax=Paenibacillus sp. L3-i20 TaxID=2905833 RepID=UPI001EE053F5|nr:effector binding domain-containing protein [Paenibacillus sp. L3-i20]GKU78144.1 hypothetical protein L3i20_v225410 [Paenibacillus sp. L3-i20]